MKFSCLFIIAILFPCFLSAQKVEVNSEGEKIVRFDDGSWRYYEPADSIYEVARKDLSNNNPPKTVQKESKPNQQLESLQEELYAIEKKIYSLRNKRKQINDKLLKTEDSQEIIELNTELQNVIRKERQNEQLYLDLTNEMENTKTMQNISPEFSQQFASDESKINIKNGVLNYNKDRIIPVIPDHIYTMVTTCEIEKEKDEISKLISTKVAPETLFTYTPKGLSGHLTDRQYVVGDVNLTHIQGRFFLQLKVDILNTKAQQSYGYIAKGSQLILQLLDGETYALRNTNNSIGTVIPQKGLTRYETNYSIDPRVINALEKTGLDKVRLVWSTGYEDYEVFHVDLLSDQIDCLSSNL